MSWTQYWAYYDITFHSLADQIRDALGPELPSYYEAEMNPHITIHPRVQFKQGDEEKFRHYLNECFPRTIQVSINRFYFHPKKHKPFVICLDVETNIPFEKKQKRFEKLIRENGGKNSLEPTRPHITLYMSKDDRGGIYRSIPSNTNQIKTVCRKIGEEKLPLTVNETSLRFEANP